MKRIATLVACCGLVSGVWAQQNTPSKPDVKPDIKHDLKQDIKQAKDQIKKGADQAKQDAKDAAKDKAKEAAQPANELPGGMDEKMMQAWMAASTPGAEHAKMAESEGEWTVSGKWWAAQGAPPTPMTGTSTMKMILGGRVMHQVFRSSDNGMEMEGHGYSAYNNVAKRFENVWMDNGATGMMFTTGTRAADGTITMTGEGSDPLAGQLKKYKTIDRSTKDSIQFEMWEIGSDGKEWKTMELNYTRAPKSTGLEVKTIDIKPAGK